MIKKVISGGQTGIDQFALFEARKIEVETGGTCPFGWRTENGREEWLQEFGLAQHTSNSYPPRTKVNIINSDGTFWFGSDDDPGYRCTYSEVMRRHKPWFEITKVDPNLFEVYLETLLKFLDHGKILTLNVAGPRGSRLSIKESETFKRLFSRALELNLGRLPSKFQNR